MKAFARNPLCSAQQAEQAVLAMLLHWLVLCVFAGCLAAQEKDWGEENPFHGSGLLQFELAVGLLQKDDVIASAGALGYFEQQDNSVHKSLELLLLPANGPRCCKHTCRAQMCNGSTQAGRSRLQNAKGEVLTAEGRLRIAAGREAHALRLVPVRQLFAGSEQRLAAGAGVSIQRACASW